MEEKNNEGKMKVFVRVKTGSKEKKVEKVDDNYFLVFIKERPIKGEANKAVVKALADYFGVAVSNVVMISGFKSRQKIIKIYEKSSYF